MLKWINARRARLGVSVALASAAIFGAPAQAVTIKFAYDSSITSLPNAATIESDMNTVAQYFDKTLSSTATVNVGVSWGAVDGQAIGGGEVSSSVENLYGYFGYSQVRGDLTAAAGSNAANAGLVTAASHLGTSAPSGVTQFAIPSAEAKALGVIPGFLPTTDGYIGFNKSTAWDFAPSNGIAAGQYDFEAAAAHELEEVLGRISGLDSTSPVFRTPFDLLRYSAPGQASFNYNSAAYFSVDGGKTNLGTFNTVNGGDRGDWLSTTTGVGDIQSAFLSPGQTYSLSGADLTALNALGWGAPTVGSGQMLTPSQIAQSFMGTGVPEPASWVLMTLGVGLVGAALRRRQSLVVA